MASNPPSPPPRRGSGLSRQVGGIPVWAWAGIAGVGVYFVYRFVKSKSTTSTTSTTTTVPTTGGVAYVATPGGGGSSGGGTSGGQSGSATLAGLSQELQTLGTKIGNITTRLQTPTTSNAANAGGPAAASYRIAPTGSPFQTGGATYKPISTYGLTLTDFAKGVPVFVQTTASGKAVAISSAAQYKALEHTGTHKFPQFVSYTKG